MPLIDSLVAGLRPIACGLGILAVVHLLRAGLHKRFRVLVLFLSFHVVRSLALYASDLFPHPRNVYAWTWVVTEPIYWIFFILLGINVHSLVLEDYKGLRTVGRWIFFVALPLAILISGMTLLSDFSNPRGNITLFYYAVLERGIRFSVVVFILVTLLLLSWYPISLSRNIVIHTLTCTIFLIGTSLAYFVRTTEGGTVMHAVNLATQVFTVLCWLAWLLLLTPKGEEKKVVVRHQFSPEEEARLVNQLTAINSSLLRASRKTLN